METREFFSKLQQVMEEGSSYVHGLQLEFTSSELKDHCSKRENYHLCLAEKYKNRVTEALQQKAEAMNAVHKATAEGKLEVPKSLEDDGDEDNFGGKGGYARVSNAAGNDTGQDEAKAKFHRNKVKFFRIFASHLISKTYRLSMHDLNELELV